MNTRNNQTESNLNTICGLTEAMQALCVMVEDQSSDNPECNALAVALNSMAARIKSLCDQELAQLSAEPKVRQVK